MWVVGILRLLTDSTNELIGGGLWSIWQESGVGENETGPVTLVRCGASEAALSENDNVDENAKMIRCSTAELGDRLTALWESGCAISIVEVGANTSNAGQDYAEYLDLAVIEIDTAGFDAMELGPVLARLDQQAVPFFFVMSGVSTGKKIPPEIPVTLAQFGTVCPFTLLGLDRDAELRQLRDYVQQRLDKHYGLRESVEEQSTPEAERRAFPRWQLDCPAVATIKGLNYPCRISDISGGGLALDLTNVCEIGEEIVVTLGAVRPLRGKVVHTGQRHIGVQFTMGAAEHSEALALIAQVVAGRAEAAE